MFTVMPLQVTRQRKTPRYQAHAIYRTLITPGLRYIAIADISFTDAVSYVFEIRIYSCMYDQLNALHPDQTDC